MSQNDRRHEIATKRVVLEIPGADAVVVRRDVPYALIDGERLTMDVYFPAGLQRHELMPAVLFVTGYPDEGMRKVVGCNAKDMASVRLVGAVDGRLGPCGDHLHHEKTCD